jgi:hypothetical protein
MSSVDQMDLLTVSQRKIDLLTYQWDEDLIDQLDQTFSPVNTTTRACGL